MQHSRLEVVWYPPGRAVRCGRSRPPIGPRNRGPLNIAEGHGGREGRQVLGAYLRGCLEARGQFDQRRLAECCPEKADAQRHAEHHARRHLYDRISRRCCQARGAEDKVVAIEQVGCPGRVVGR